MFEALPPNVVGHSSLANPATYPGSRTTNRERLSILDLRPFSRELSAQILLPFLHSLLAFSLPLLAFLLPLFGGLGSLGVVLKFLDDCRVDAGNFLLGEVDGLFRIGRYLGDIQGVFEQATGIFFVGKSQR